MTLDDVSLEILLISARQWRVMDRRQARVSVRDQSLIRCDTRVRAGVCARACLRLDKKSPDTDLWIWERGHGRACVSATEEFSTDKSEKEVFFFSFHIFSANFEILFFFSRFLVETG